MSRRAEVLSAALWLAAGGAIVIASWRMDRLDKLGINPWSAPGLTPGIIGALIVVFALALLWRSLRADAGSPADCQAEHPVCSAAQDGPLPTTGSARRSAAAVLLCVLFAGISLGHGWPFAVEGALFILVFTAAFSWSTWRAERRIGRGLVQTLVVAVLASAFISWLFESVFLVRLP
jgi:Tripartite tricarboxylate transporter TctB family